MPRPVQDADPAGVLPRELICETARAVRRLIVDDEKTEVRLLHQSRREHGQIREFVVGRNDDERRPDRHGWWRSKRSDEICSETSPTRKMITLSKISSTDEFVTCDCVEIVQMAYTPPSPRDAALSGRKIRIGLKIVITLKRMTKN